MTPEQAINRLYADWLKAEAERRALLAENAVLRTQNREQPQKEAAA